MLSNKNKMICSVCSHIVLYIYYDVFWFVLYRWIPALSTTSREKYSIRARGWSAVHTGALPGRWCLPSDTSLRFELNWRTAQLQLPSWFPAIRSNSLTLVKGLDTDPWWSRWKEVGISFCCSLLKALFLVIENISWDPYFGTHWAFY